MLFPRDYRSLVIPLSPSMANRPKRKAVDIIGEPGTPVKILRDKAKARPLT